MEERPAASASVSFDFDAFGRALGYAPWPYSPGTYRQAGGRWLDWHKGERLLGLPHSELLLSEHDPAHARPRLWPFPAPKSLADAVAIVVSVGWVEDTPAARAALSDAYAVGTRGRHE